jgi:hypothetical protein
MKMQFCCGLLLTCAALTCATLTMAPVAFAENLPAGLSGSWKLTRMLPKKPAPASAACTPSAAFYNKRARGTRVQMDDHKIAWGPESAKDPDLRIRSVGLSDFNAKYADAGVTANALGLRSQQLEVIDVGAHDTLPFDTIVVRDPSTLLFGRCGLFMEAVHDSGFVAPQLPTDR